MKAMLADAGNSLAAAQSNFISNPTWKDLLRWGYRCYDATAIGNAYGDLRYNWGINSILSGNGLSTNVFQSFNHIDALCDYGHWSDEAMLSYGMYAVLCHAL